MKTVADKKMMKKAILDNTDEMNPDLVFKIYEKLAFELKKELESNDLVPNLIKSENGEVHPSKEDLEKN